MSLNAELADAARWARAASERLPEADRPDIAIRWGRLMDSVEDARSEGAAILEIISWRQELAEDLEAHPQELPSPIGAPASDRAAPEGRLSYDGGAPPNP